MRWLYCLLLAALVSAKVRYDGHQVLRLVPRNRDQLQVLRDLEDSPNGLDFWTSARAVNVTVDVRVPPQMRAGFLSAVNTHGLETQVFIDDVQKMVDSQERRAGTPRAEFDWTSYHDLDELNAWLLGLNQSFPVVQPVVGGRTYEGRDIQGVKVSYKAGNPRIFVESGIHAREWIAPATATWILNQLLTSQDEDVRFVAENFDWYIFPSVNPDGYQYSHTTDRMWRKTRTPGTRCFGVDGNRNWDNYWNQGGASSNECSETYAGTGPFSTVEASSLAATIQGLSPSVYLCFHSYSQLLMIPYGHQFQTVSNYDQLMSIGNAAAESLAQRYGTQYEMGPIYEVIYVATGGSMDWAASSAGVQFPFEWELRDTGHYGFLLPADQIVPTAQETLDSVVTILKLAAAALRS
ncbi:zinc carboxypeptidase-like [Periplaneta americana]|uniref:zinc carboxypeptidase-like n=1 Tax=Periplaneta americana TaxID=6978 RepID=UPI0037E8DE80